MKTLKYLCLALLAVLAASCEKDEVGATATEAVAGQWYVTAEAVDANGNTVFSDDELFGLGHFLVLTYNTADNKADELWVNDLGNFWNFAVKAKSDVSAKTFATDGAVANTAYDDCDVTVEGGKVMYGAATTPHGTAADSIVFYVSFSDDSYPAAYGYAKYKVSGYRYTGLTQDE